MVRQEPGATQLGFADHGLLCLVDELLLNIVDQIDDHEALCNLAATCVRFQGLVEPYVWRKLLVLTGAHARRISLALDRRDERMDYIKELSIRYKDDYRDGIEELNYFMSLMGKLRHLTIETPCPNNLEWRSGVYFDGWSRIDYTNLLASAVYPRQGLPLALPVLQSLTLHGHGAGDRKFMLGRAVAMFRHPTLRRITLSCLNFDGDIGLDNISRDDCILTPLQSLTLVECNVNVQFLTIILSLPKALRELLIGERLHTFPECEPPKTPSTRTSSKQFLTALQQQAHSLQRLRHVGGQIAHQTPREVDLEGSEKLRSFICLEHLELGIESNLYYYLRQNGWPPALKTLKMLDAAISLNAGHDMRSLSEIAFHSLTSLVTEHLPMNLPPGFTLHLNFADHPFFRLFLMADASEQNYIMTSMYLNRPATYKIATIMKSLKSRFLVSRETFPSGTSYIPPYMYGEELPVEEIMYDSDDYWRFYGVNYQVMDDEQLRSELMEKNKLIACINCRRLGIGADRCLNLGDGSFCWRCRMARVDECLYERDDHGNLV
ncbi:Nn.00g014510.m01.CDS01 [Neocucurbitaria sp. VM-36]